jgi:5-methylcytosine-specific restriction endonuclease McrA
MAEGRMLKKAISTSRRLADLKTDSARLLYTWMIPHLDIEGRFYADPMVIKGSVVPRLKGFMEAEITDCLEDMDRVGLITLYVVDGERYFHLRKFEDHQTLNPKREAPSKIPNPATSTKRRCLKKSTWERIWTEWENSDKRCPVCGKQSIFIPGIGNVIDGYINLHIDHKLPISKGGTNDDENLRIICAKCNLSKGNSIDNITLDDDNSRSTQDNSRSTQDNSSTREDKIREDKISKVNARARGDDQIVDNYKIVEKDELIKEPKEIKNEWTEQQQEQLTEIISEIHNRYGQKYKHQAELFIQTRFHNGNKQALVYCLQSLLDYRKSGKAIDHPKAWLDAAFRDQDGKHNAKEHDSAAQEFKKPLIRGELNNIKAVLANIGA